MLFNSPEFLFVFLPVSLLLYVLTHRNNLILLFVSLLFYISSGTEQFLILVGVIFANYFIVRFISDHKSGKALALGVSLNLMVLIYFKYFGFIVSDVLSIKEPSSWLDPVLPIGISFYIFQCISLLVDQYRTEDTRPVTFSHVATYVTMFPQLIAGPIVRFDSVRDKLNSRDVTQTAVIAGWLIFTAGLAQKVLIADNVAEYVDSVFALNPDDLSLLSAWTGAMAYTVQIYFDFAGYSNMAIGIGLWLGFKFPANFDFPYSSKSITEFWRRWHMSLSSWFRDYLYIPLGGNRKGNLNTYRNLIVVFLICGIWHGASWNFVLWGAFHGAFLTLERALRIPSRLKNRKIIGPAYCILVVLHGWVLFRAPDLEHALQYFASMYSSSGDSTVYLSHMTMFAMICGAIIATGVVSKLYDVDHEVSSLTALPLKLAMSCFYIVMSSVFILSGSYSAFIYFQF